jgi:hypothetical protein
MSLSTCEFNKIHYPKFQSEGNAAQFAIPFAKHLCIGQGYDIGCNRLDWAYPGARPIDLVFDDEWNAYSLPDNLVDYIFSSHCLEHLPNWVTALDYWLSKIKSGGVLFLYLPHYSQEYWRPWNNRKHIHALAPTVIKDYLLATNLINKEKLFITGEDLNNSFIVVAEKL